MVSDNLIVSEVNNKAVDQGFFSKKSNFPIILGKNAVILRYKDVFEDLNFAEDRVVESNEFVVKFTVLSDDDLILKTEKIANLREAEAFSKKPVLILKDHNNNLIEMQLENVSDYKIEQQVNIAVNSYVTKQAVKEYETLQKNKVKKNTQVVSESVQQKTSDNTLIQIKAFPMLKYWWQNASNEEKKQFKEFLAAEK